MICAAPQWPHGVLTVQVETDSQISAFKTLDQGGQLVCTLFCASLPMEEAARACMSM